MRCYFTALVASISLAALAGCAAMDNAPRASATEAHTPAGVGPHGKNLYYFMVFVNAAPGQEEEFNRWYDRIHAPVMIETGDFVWAQRFKLSPEQFVPEQVDKTAGAGSRRQYLVIFAIETDDIKKVIADANRRLALPRNVPGKAILYGTLQGLTYEALGPRITQKQAQEMLAVETAAGRVPSPDVPASPRKPGDPFGAGPGAGGPPPQ